MNDVIVADGAGGANEGAAVLPGATNAGAAAQQVVRVVLQDNSNSNKIMPLTTFPKTRLVSVVARVLGITSYNDLPSPELHNYAFFMTPIAMIFLFDSSNIKSKDVRHQIEEGVILKAYRNACRKFLGSESSELEKLLAQMADVFLSFRSGVGADGLVSNEDMDEMIQECLPIHRAMSDILVNAHAAKMPAAARSTFLAHATMKDSRLPVHLAAAETAAIKASTEERKRGRDSPPRRGLREPPAKRDGKKDPPSTKPDLKDNEFFCKACNKVLDKERDKEHSKSKEHEANKKKR